MPALNRVQLIGYLGRDPETRFTPTGQKVCRFSVAVSRRWTSKEGESKEATDWFNIEAWDRLGEICQESSQERQPGLPRRAAAHRPVRKRRRKTL